MKPNLIFDTNSYRFITRDIMEIDNSLFINEDIYKLSYLLTFDMEIPQHCVEYYFTNHNFDKLIASNLLTMLNYYKENNIKENIAISKAYTHYEDGSLKYIKIIEISDSCYAYLLLKNTLDDKVIFNYIVSR